MRHVLFVDDEAAVLSGLRRTLHRMRAEWRMTFVMSTNAALDVLDREPVDVVVTDMRMPGQDGADLLRQVRERWPQTVRIVLSGYANQGAAMRSVPVAHRFISKPCDIATLSAALLSACELQERLSRPELRTLVSGLGSLPSAPQSFAAITAVLEQPDVSLPAVADAIEQDAGCSAKLLQLVNSAFFGLAREITTVQAAVTYLGLGPVRDVVLAAEVADMFRCASPDLARTVSEINDHSLAVAAAARDLAPPAQAHDAFIAGVLHDVGRLALAAVAPEEFRAVQVERRQRGVPLSHVEQVHFDATHADVGAYLLRLWGLPFTLVDAVARHHDPDAGRDPDPVVAAVAVAEAMAAGDADEPGGDSEGPATLDLTAAGVAAPTPEVRSG